VGEVRPVVYRTERVVRVDVELDGTRHRAVQRVVASEIVLLFAVAAFAIVRKATFARW
jgi:hypothetical protein